MFFLHRNCDEECKDRRQCHEQRGITCFGPLEPEHKDERVQCISQKAQPQDSTQVITVDLYLFTAQLENADHRDRRNHEANCIERDGMKIAVHELHQREVETPDHDNSNQQQIDDVAFAPCHHHTLTWQSPGERNMRTREFGGTGRKVSIIGQGTWAMKNNGRDALKLGIELGMTHIDTAEMYTGAEELIGQVIRNRRKEIFLVSKVMPSNASYKGTIRACDASLKRLNTDYLDVYLLHWWSGSHPIAETMQAMEDLVATGKIRYLGVSNLDVDRLKQAQKSLTREKIVCNQVMYHLRSRGVENSLIPYCESQKIAVVGYSPFGQGDFPAPSSKQGKALATVAERHGKTPRQVALNFLTRRPSLFAIPKASRVDHVRENAGGYGWELTPQDLKLIDEVFPVPGKDEPLD